MVGAHHTLVYVAYGASWISTFGLGYLGGLLSSLWFLNIAILLCLFYRDGYLQFVASYCSRGIALASPQRCRLSDVDRHSKFLFSPFCLEIHHYHHKVSSCDPTIDVFSELRIGIPLSSSLINLFGLISGGRACGKPTC